MPIEGRSGPFGHECISAPGEAGPLSSNTFLRQDGTDTMQRRNIGNPCATEWLGSRFIQLLERNPWF